MFDIAFSELLVIAVVALIVIGPEKLPKVARTLGLLAGRMQRYMAGVKADVERELRAHELQDLGAEVRQGIAAVESQVAREVRQVESTVETPVAEAARIAESAGKTDVSPGSP